MKLLTCITLLVALVAAQDTSLVVVKSAFDQAQIPHDLNITFDPKLLLEVTLPQANGSCIPLKAGVQLPVNATTGPPQFAVRGFVAPRERFVAIAVDPDAAPSLAQIRHFLNANFVPLPGLPGELNLLNETAPISPWLQPGPPPGDPVHRYIFFLFHQPANFNNQTLVTANTSIEQFNLSSFAQSTGLGSPVAGTFMRVASDSPT